MELCDIIAFCFRHHNWGYDDNPRCTCGELQTMQHLLECAQLDDENCTVEDIRATNNVDTALYYRRDTNIYIYIYIYIYMYPSKISQAN